MKDWQRFLLAFGMMAGAAVLLEQGWPRVALMLAYYAGITVSPLRTKLKWVV